MHRFREIHESEMGRLNDLPEMQREEILAQRQEEMQKRLDSQNLTKLLAAHQGAGEDSVANAAKRALVEVLVVESQIRTNYTIQGNTRRGERPRKSHSLLTSSRLDARPRRRGSLYTYVHTSYSIEHHYNYEYPLQIAEKKDSPTKRTSPASSDMEFDSEEEGQLSPRGRDDYDSDPASPVRERERIRDRRKEERSKTDATNKAAVLDRKTTREDLTRIQLTRTQLMKECMKPWFEDYVKRTYERLIESVLEAD